jgi:hypothetical protein
MTKKCKTSVGPKYIVKPKAMLEYFFSLHQNKMLTKKNFDPTSEKKLYTFFVKVILQKLYFLILSFYFS